MKPPIDCDTRGNSVLSLRRIDIESSQAVRKVTLPIWIRDPTSSRFNGNTLCVDVCLLACCVCKCDIFNLNRVGFVGFVVFIDSCAVKRSLINGVV